MADKISERTWNEASEEVAWLILWNSVVFSCQYAIKANIQFPDSTPLVFSSTSKGK